MATRPTSRHTARRQRRRARAGADRSRYRRSLRIEPLEDRRLLAVVTVTTLDDSIDFNDGLTSLREAIFATNLVAGADTIEFAPDLTAAGPATILLTQGELQIIDSLTINGPGAHLLTIDASGNDPTPDIDDRNGTRVLNIDDGNATALKSVSITGLTLTGGDLHGSGAGIFSRESLTITDSKISGNTADQNGGGVFTSDADVTITDSIIASNLALQGAGIQINGGQATVVRTSIEDNLLTSPPTVFGSGIDSINANLNISESTISGNAGVPAKPGAGIRWLGTENVLKITGSTLFSNSYALFASANGGSIDLAHTTVKDNNSGIGAQISNGGILTISDSSILNSERHGVGVSSIGGGGLTTITRSVITGNQTGGLSFIGAGGHIAINESVISNNRTVLSSTFNISNGGGIYLGRNTTALIVDCLVSNNVASRNGGGIFAAENVEILRTTVANNEAGYSGGGVFMRGGSVADSLITGNSAGRIGGGIAAYLYDVDPLEIQHCTLSNNVATIRGGGLGLQTLFTFNQTATLQSVRIVQNSAVIGGGASVFARGTGRIAFVDSTVADNSAQYLGGGLQLTSTDGAHIIVQNSDVVRNTARTESGGGVHSQMATGGTVSINHSTISSNAAYSGGSGIAFAPISLGSAGAASLRHSTVVDNETLNSTSIDGGGIHMTGREQFQVFIEHSIVAGHRVNGLPASDLVEVSDNGFTVRHSLIGNGTNSGLPESPTPDAHGNLIGGPIYGIIDPLLGPLADNGGPNLTHALLPGSPAINRGDLNAVAGANGVPLFDQRGDAFGRVAGGRLDIGAFESQEPSDLNLVVDTLTDEQDGNYERGDLSLREAIALANMWSGPDTIHFDPALTAAGPATILLTQGELQITDSLTINGPGADLLAIDASGNDPTPDEKIGDGSRVVLIDDNSLDTLIDVTISQLTMTGGDALNSGGAIFSTENLTLVACTISGNAAVAVEELTFSYGGGINHREGHLTLSDSTISNNFAYIGGGVFAESGRLTITGSLVSGNSASSAGGIFHGDGDATISRSTIRDNFAPGTFSLGGGIYTSGNLTINDTTISGNVGGFGGGLFARNDAYGSTSTRIVNSTISGNTATVRGGGVRNALGNTFIEHSTITDNTAPANQGSGVASRGYDTSRTYLRHTIVAGNTRSDVDFVTGGINTFESGGYNLIGTGRALAAFDGPFDQTGVTDPRLGPLADNGGPTVPDGSHVPTHALLPNSPAINAGDLSAVRGQGGVPLFDQRGNPFYRIYGGQIDIGAVESQPNPLPGDYNFNGLVDAADFSVWRNTLNSTTDLRADGNSDGVVNDLDRLVWNKYFGRNRAGMDTLAPPPITPIAPPAQSVAPSAQPSSSPSVSLPEKSTSGETASRKTRVDERSHFRGAAPIASRPQFAPSLRMAAPRSALSADSTFASRDAALVAWIRSTASADGRHDRAMVPRAREIRLDAAVDALETGALDQAFAAVGASDIAGQH